MDSKLSVTEIVARLEEQIAHLAEREAFHASQEESHRAQRASCKAELDRLSQCRDSFKTAAATVAELMAVPQPTPPPPAPPLELPDMGKRFRLARLVEKVLERKGPHEPFGSKAILAEVNQAFGARLERRFGAREVSAALSSLAERGRIVRLEKGRPFHGSQYVRSREAFTKK
jgi:hypothetical protein